MARAGWKIRYGRLPAMPGDRTLERRQVGLAVPQPDHELLDERAESGALRSAS